PVRCRPPPTLLALSLHDALPIYAIMLPRDDGDAARIVILCILLTALTAVLLTVASLFSEGVAALLGVDAIAPWLWLLAPTLLLIDRKSTRLNSSHVKTSYAVFCL